MVRDGSVTRLIQLLRSDDPAERDLAARLIWRRYFRDLLELARNNLNRRIRRREDEEDVLQSMYKSFCLRQQRGEFDLASRAAGGIHQPRNRRSA
ncbi:MAG: ECF-type sigma factor [Isosphaerales bacterium]